MTTKGLAEAVLDYISFYDDDELKHIQENWTEYCKELKKLFDNEVEGRNEDDDDDDNTADRLGNGNED